MSNEAESFPNSEYQAFLLMEELMDKLKLLDYEKDFCKALRIKPLSKFYFAIATNPGEQFHTFTSLCAWLIRSNSGSMEQPQEYDDPNAVVTQILNAVRGLEQPIDFPPSRLKSGCGEACIRVATILADAVLQRNRFVWRPPVYPDSAGDGDAADIATARRDDDEDEEDEEGPESQEITVQNARKHAGKGARGATAQESSGFRDDESIEEDHDFLDDNTGNEAMESDMLAHRAATASTSTTASGAGAGSRRPDEILPSTTDGAIWQLEVERVLPQLRVTIRGDAKDWRGHLEQMQGLRDELRQQSGQTQLHLERVHTELARTMEKVGTREKYLNSQMEPLLNQFRAKQDQLSAAREQYRQASAGIAERTRMLADISEELERIKQSMEERGSSMTDGSPLLRIKQALQRLRQEMVQMDIRIGVLEHILLQEGIRATADSYRSQMEAGGGSTLPQAPFAGGDFMLGAH